MSSPTLLIDKSVKKIEYLFRVTGINIKVGEKSKFDKYRCWFFFILNIVWLNYDVAAAIIWFMEGVAQNQSFTELTYLAPCITISCLATIKISSMFANETTIELLLEEIRKLEKEQNKRDGDSNTEEIIKSEHKFLHRLLRILIIFYNSMTVSFTTSPGLLLLYKYFKTNKVEFLLPVQASYPFDPFDVRYYPWVYLYQSWTVLLCVFYISSADFIFYICCTNLRVQFRLLQHYVERLIPGDTERSVLNCTKGIEIKMMELIGWHQRLLSVADILESIYTKSTLFNFITSSILICLAGFNVVEIDAYVLSFVSFLLMSLLQIFFLCYFGDLLMESSMAIGDAVYNCKWYLTDPKLIKTLLIVKIRSQRPCKLTAWSYADVNLNAFMKICGTAWSYFALLRTMYTAPTH